MSKIKTGNAPLDDFFGGGVPYWVVEQITAVHFDKVRTRTVVGVQAKTKMRPNAASLLAMGEDLPKHLSCIMSSTGDPLYASHVLVADRGFAPFLEDGSVVRTVIGDEIILRDFRDDASR